MLISLILLIFSNVLLIGTLGILLVLRRRYMTDGEKGIYSHGDFDVLIPDGFNLAPLARDEYDQGCFATCDDTEEEYVQFRHVFKKASKQIEISVLGWPTLFKEPTRVGILVFWQKAVEGRKLKKEWNGPAYVGMYPCDEKYNGYVKELHPKTVFPFVRIVDIPVEKGQYVFILGRDARNPKDKLEGDFRLFKVRVRNKLWWRLSA